MKEILYIQAGPLANYIGTHYWNTQAAYFTYEEADEAHEVEHDVSFREGINHKGEPTYSPRLIAFDRKSNFVAVPDGDGDSNEENPLWDGKTVDYRPDPITQTQANADGEPRSWQDFSRVDYSPRTPQMLPDVADWEDVDGLWSAGQEMFTRYNEDTSLMEGPVRLSFEESDFPQGIQIMNDTSSFGSFTHSFISSFRDELLKMPCLVFPLLSDAVPRHIGDGNIVGTRKAINDALYLRGLNELSTMSIPIQSPSNWSQDAWGPHLTPDPKSMYHTSAVLAAHVETSTLPLRMKNTHDDLSSFIGRLNWQGFTSFGQLSGTFPVIGAVKYEDDVYNFSSGRLNNVSTPFARRDVTRGFSSSSISSYEKWSASLSLPDSMTATSHGSAFPINKAFPQFFTESSTRSMRGTKMSQTVPASVQGYSSVSTMSTTGDLFSDYATFIERYLRGNTALLSPEYEADDMKDLVNDLWTIHDNYNADGNDEIGGEDDFGEDEE